MFRAIRGIKDRVAVFRNMVDARIREIKSDVNDFSLRFFPRKQRRMVFTAFWISGKFFWEFFSILLGVAKWFENLLIKIATYWQTVFWNRKYGSLFAGMSIFSLRAAYIFWAPEFLIIIFLLIIIPLIFACLCSIAAGAVVEFFCLFFKFMPPLIWVPAASAPLGIAAALAAVRTKRAWEEHGRKRAERICSGGEGCRNGNAVVV